MSFVDELDGLCRSLMSWMMEVIGLVAVLFRLRFEWLVWLVRRFGSV